MTTSRKGPKTEGEAPKGSSFAQPEVSDYTPEIAGFSYVEDDAAYRICCDACEQTAGTLGRSEDYAHGWLDHWAFDHLDDCLVRQGKVVCDLCGPGFTVMKLEYDAHMRKWHGAL